jgi:hypothetical protein
MILSNESALCTCGHWKAAHRGSSSDGECMSPSSGNNNGVDVWSICECKKFVSSMETKTETTS